MTAKRLAFLTLYMAFLIVAPGCNRLVRVIKPDPVDAHCSAECSLPCDPPLDLVDGSGDTLLAVSKVNRGFLVRCSARHDACRVCLDALKKSGVIQP